MVSSNEDRLRIKGKKKIKVEKGNETGNDQWRESLDGVCASVYVRRATRTKMTMSREQSRECGGIIITITRHRETETI